MAEDLGTIRLAIGSPSGGGPDPTKAAGAGVGAVGFAGMVDGKFVSGLIAKIQPVTAGIIEGIRAIIRNIRWVADKIESGIQDITEASKWSATAIVEVANNRLLAVQQQFQSAQILGPMYAMVLKWYRELMVLLQPWKIYFQAMLAFMTGALIQSVLALAPLLRLMFRAIVDATLTITQFLVDTAETGGSYGPQLTQFSQFLDALGYGLSMMNPSETGAILWSSRLQWLSSLIGQGAETSNSMSAAAEALRKLQEELTRVLVQAEQINSNTRKKEEFRGADWIVNELRLIAQGSNPYYRQGQPGGQDFWK